MYAPVARVFLSQLTTRQYNENYKFRNDVPVPTPGPGELLIRVASAGFCHTDYQVYQGAYGTQLPFTGSHEAAGTIVRLGPNVLGDWKVNDRVGVINFRNPCNACKGCRWRMNKFGSLDARYCENKTMSGILGADGGFAEYMITSSYSLVHLPSDLSFDQAAPLMCAGVCVFHPYYIGEPNLQSASRPPHGMLSKKLGWKRENRSQLWELAA